MNQFENNNNNSYLSGLTGAASMPRLLANHPRNTISRTAANPTRRHPLRTAHFNPVHGDDDDTNKVTPYHDCKYCLKRPYHDSISFSNTLFCSTK